VGRLVVLVGGSQLVLPGLAPRCLGRAGVKLTGMRKRWVPSAVEVLIAPDSHFGNQPIVGFLLLFPAEQIGRTARQKLPGIYQIR